MQLISYTDMQFTIVVFFANSSFVIGLFFYLVLAILFWFYENTRNDGLLQTTNIKSLLFKYVLLNIYIMLYNMVS